jgi:putative hemolysin
MQVLIEIVIILLLLAGNGVLAMAEMSLVSARKARLAAMAEEGNQGAARALTMAESPNQFLSTVQIGITLVGIFAGAFGGSTLAEVFAAQLVHAGLSPTLAESVALATVVLAITYLSLIIGELVPKRLALAAPERYASALSGVLRVIATLATPAVKILGKSTDLALKFLGVKQESTSQVSEEEVRQLMLEGRTAGVFHHSEPQIVQRVLELDDLPVKAIMTPRPRVIFFNQDEAHEHVWPKIAGSRHSHFPVYQGNRDNIVGVVSVKAIYANLAAGAPVCIRDLMLPPQFVPASQSVMELLDGFRSSGRHFAIVADEFGTTVGVVTLVDVLEAIVGQVPSIEERARPLIRSHDNGSWLVDGTAAIGEIESAIPGLKFAEPDERTYQTLAGFILQQLGHIPQEGEVITTDGYRFEIIDMDRQRIDKVMVRKVDPAVGSA